MSMFPVPVRARNMSDILAGLPFPAPAVGVVDVGVTVAPAGVNPPSHIPFVPGPSATTVPIVTAPIGADLEDIEVWNSVLIAERMLATAAPCEQDGMRFLLGMIASR